MLEVFKRLLLAENFQQRMDRRIAKALMEIEMDTSKQHTLPDLANAAGLSISQFKVLFAKHTGMSLGKYLLVSRMEKAENLLCNTNTPVSTVAAQSGYSDQSAFSRRFRSYFGVSPTLLRKTRQH